MSTLHHPRTMLNEILTQAANDPWARFGMVGILLSACGKWLLLNVSEHLGTLSLALGALMTIVVIVDKVVDIRIKLNKARRDRDDEISEDQQD